MEDRQSARSQTLSEHCCTNYLIHTHDIYRERFIESLTSPVSFILAPVQFLFHFPGQSLKKPVQAKIGLLQIFVVVVFFFFFFLHFSASSQAFVNNLTDLWMRLY